MHIRIAAIAYSSIFLALDLPAQAMQSPSQLTFMGDILPIEAPLDSSDFSQDFLSLTGLTRLTKHRARIDISDVGVITQHLSTQRGAPISENGVAAILLYTADSTDPSDVTTSCLKGLSLMREVNGALLHEYYETGPLGLVQAAGLSGALSGPITMHLIRLMHFGATAHEGMPDQSDIYAISVSPGTTVSFGS